MWMALLADSTLCGSLLDEKASPQSSICHHLDVVSTPGAL